MLSSRFVFSALLLVALGATAGCGSSSEPAAPQSVRIALRLGDLEMDSFVLRRDVEAQLTVVGFDAAGNVVEGLSPAFTSRAPNTVSVSNSGLARGLEPGRTRIIATVASGSLQLRDSMEVFVPEFP